MSKYERRLFFDRLYALRAAYRRQEHASTGMTVTAAIAYAISLLDDPAALADAIGPDAAESAAATPNPGA